MLRIKRERKSPYWYVRGTVAGQPVYESTGTADRRKAEAYRRKREAQIYDSKALGRKSVATWGEAVNAYLDLGKSDRFLLKLVNHWGDMPLDKIDQQEIGRTAALLYPNVSNASLVRQVYGPVNAVLCNAAECGLEGVSPRKIKFPKVPKRKVTDWATDEYLARLLPHCDAELRAVLLVMTFTGLRTGEVLGLTAQAFRIQPGKVLVDQTKNGEAAFVPLPQLAQEAVAAVLPDAGRAFAWGTSQGLCRALRAACDRAGVRYLAPHKVGRHAFAARLLNAGYDIKTVKEAGRWKKLQVVDESYGHLEQRAAHKAMIEVAENLRTQISDLSTDEGELIVITGKKEAVLD